MTTTTSSSCGGPGGYAAGALRRLGRAVRRTGREGEGRGHLPAPGCIPAKSLLHAARVSVRHHAAEHGVSCRTGSRSRTGRGTAAGRYRRQLHRAVPACSAPQGPTSSMAGVGSPPTGPSPGRHLRGRADRLRGLGTAGHPGMTRRERVVTSDHATNSEADRSGSDRGHVGVIGSEFASVYTDMGVQTTLLEPPTACCRSGPDRDGATCWPDRSSGAAPPSTPSPRRCPGAHLQRRTRGRSRPRRSRRRSRSTMYWLDRRAGRPGTSGRGAGSASTAAASSRSTPRRWRPRVRLLRVGDCVATPGLAHVLRRGLVAVDLILGEQAVRRLRQVPGGSYTHPEVAWTA